MNLTPALVDLTANLGTAQGDAAPWSRFRAALFPGMRLNLNPATLGTPSTWVTDAMAAFMAEERHAFPLGQYVKGRDALALARGLAQRIFAPGQDAPAITTGTTETVNLMALTLLANTRGTRPLQVLTTHHEHYGGIEVFKRHPGFEVRYAPRDSLVDPAALATEVEALRPDLLFLSQIAWTDGVALPLPSLIGAARSASPETLILIDSAQALGLIPPPVGLADGVVASAHKWLFGPPGTGFLWLSERLRERLGGTHLNGEPLDPGAAMSPFEVAGGQDFSRYAGVVAALSLYRAVGPDRIRARGRFLGRGFLDRLLPALAARGVDVRRLRSSAEGSPGMVSLQFEGRDPYPLYASLNTQGIHMKCIKTTLGDGTRLNALRIGFPYYEEPQRLAAAADAMLAHIDEEARHG